ncbi:MAG: ferritin [Actinobacteria bacterium]|nr:MAG: ferritin [Actinomycetota bacterium]
MPAQRFVDALNAQLGREFGASQQYVAAAVHYDASTLPRLAAFFYRQALEERGHAMMMVRYLLDAGAEATISGLEAPRTEWSDPIEPIAMALDQERAVTGAIDELMTIARDERDYASEQFVSWFVKEQVEEESTMSSLLAVAERCRDDLMQLEEYVARELAATGDDPSAPPPADAGA